MSAGHPPGADRLSRRHSATLAHSGVGPALLAMPVRGWFDAVMVGVVLVTAAAMLTAAEQWLFGENSLALYVGIYLTAAVVATWVGGLVGGGVVILAGSLLSLHAPAAAPQSSWYFDPPHEVRLASFAIVAALVAIAMDRIHRAGQALARANRQEETILQLLPVGVAIIEREDGTAKQRMNRAMAAMLAADLTEQATALSDNGTRFERDGETVSEADLPMNAVIASGRSLPAEHLDLVRRDGSVRRVRAQATPLVEDDTVLGAVAVFVDDTAEREREERLKRALQAKDEFLGMVSHELRTPLTIIAGNAEILTRRSAHEDENLRLAVEDMRAASARMLANVNNLIALSTTGDRMLDLEPFPLRRVIDAVAAQHCRYGQQVVVVQGATEIVALGVPDVVTQVLDNLLENAAKYGSPGEPVEIVVRETRRDVEISVRDRGVGIPRDQLEAVFTPFYRSAHSSDLATGMGIGLAVCRHLVTAMGGRIWAAVSDGGADFRFTLAKATGEEPS